MIIVTGTKRSGTSMWMQILAAAGLPTLGDQHPPRFRDLQDANPAGFWESRLRFGVWHATNPDPKTGVYLHPDDTRSHALKVFIPGLVRSDHAFLHRVIATVRPWREYVASMRRLEGLEEQALRAAKDSDADAELFERAEQRTPPELEWWREMYSLIRDISTRRYPVHLVTYAHLLEHAEEEIPAVLRWIGEGDPAPAIAAVRAELRTQDAPDVTPTAVDAEAVAVFDAVYQAVHEDRALEPPLLARMNALHARLRAL